MSSAWVQCMQGVISMSLQIDRGLQNDSFANWRLGKEFVTSRSHASLPGALEAADIGNASDYLQTRASVLHNHVNQSQGQAFIFTRDGPGVTLWQAQPSSNTVPPVLLSKVIELPPCELPPAASLAPGLCRCDCSLAVIAQPAGSAVDGRIAAAIPGILVSRGYGDVSLIQASADPAVPSLSRAVFPIREHAPLTGVRPVKLASAYINSQGQLRCAMWAVRKAAAGQYEAACDLYLVTLSVAPVESQPTCLHVQEVQLMVSTALPPHCILSNPATDSLLLGVDPSSLSVTQPQHNLPANGATHNGAMSESNGQAAATTSAAAQPQPNGAAAAAAAASTGEAVEHIDCRRGMALDEDADDDDGDMDPRTLAEAAARLAQYTSEEPVGNLPAQQWADLYKEGGPEDVAADTGCELLAWSPLQGSTWQLACGAHKVLSADTPGLLAVTDDVDACVLQPGWDAQGAPQMQHVATIPALAYVAAGKTHRKHLLLGPPDNSAPCSAVLVEGTRFYYVYGRLQGKPTHGLQQVVDMQLDAQERVMGAALLCGSPWTAPSSSAGVLLLLTNHRLQYIAAGEMGYDVAPWIFKGRALYQLQLVKTEEARKYIPEQFKLVDFFGYTLGSFYLARYDDSPVGAFDELVAMAGLVWNPPTSCAWAARVYVNNKEARNHGLSHVGLPSRLATFEEVLPDGSKEADTTSNTVAKGKRSWWRQLHSPAGREHKLTAGSYPVQINNTDKAGWWRAPIPVCTLQLPAARDSNAFAGPRIKMALPSFSGATPACPDLLKYACDLWTNVRLVAPAVVQVPRPPAGEDGRTASDGAGKGSEWLTTVLNGKPLIAIAFDHMEMTVQEPERLHLNYKSEPTSKALTASIGGSRC